MPRNMSFMHTLEQMHNRSKTVTRRLGWYDLQVGDILNACEKCQGIEKGELVKIGQILVLDVRIEKLSKMTNHDCVLEGFPNMNAEEFIDFFQTEMSKRRLWKADKDALEKVNPITSAWYRAYEESKGLYIKRVIPEGKWVQSPVSRASLVNRIHFFHLGHDWCVYEKGEDQESQRRVHGSEEEAKFFARWMQFILPDLNEFVCEPCNPLSHPHLFDGSVKYWDASLDKWVD